MFHPIREVVLLSFLLAGTVRAQTVFVNELHYDNASTDANEAIEIAGPAGASLTGWSIALYNGNGGTVYSTINLSGAIPNQCANFGVVSVPAAGIQNGPPDGLALVNGLGQVVVDPDLMKVAEAQSMAMAARNKLDHDVKGPLARRLSNSGYPATAAVENVSAGYHTLAEAFSGWRDSPPHRANMLSRDVTKLGIAASYAPNTKYKVFWTLILASTDAR